MRKCAPIEIKLYYPTTDEGKRELARRVSAVHADFVDTHIQKLNCPVEQKLKLLDSVVSRSKEAAKTD